MKCPKCGHRRAKKGRCKFCNRINNKNWNHTVIGLLKRRYIGMCYRSRKRGWPAPNMTRDEFIDCYKNDKLFLHLFYTWRDFNWNKKKTPSMDRIDPELPYQRGNLQWITWEENWCKNLTTDHRDPETVQLSLTSAEPPEQLSKSELMEFCIRPQYSFVYGAFLLGKWQFKQALLFDTVEETEEFCKSSKYSLSMVQEAVRLEPGKNGKTAVYKYGIMHKLGGFLKIPF